MRYVLFVCDHNAGRSLIAEALFNRDAPSDLRAESGGLHPAKEVPPTVIEAMNEIGVDLSGRRPQKVTVEQQLHADLAIATGKGEVLPHVPREVERWGLPQIEEMDVAGVRGVRDEIARLVGELLSTRADEIRHDQSGHEHRLRRLMMELESDFGSEIGHDELHELAEAELAKYDDAKIRTHIVTIAHHAISRRLRERSRQPR